MMYKYMLDEKGLEVIEIQDTYTVEHSLAAKYNCYSDFFWGFLCSLKILNVKLNYLYRNCEIAKADVISVSRLA